jgi:hypothetical protein
MTTNNATENNLFSLKPDPTGRVHVIFEPYNRSVATIPSSEAYGLTQHDKNVICKHFLRLAQKNGEDCPSSSDAPRLQNQTAQQQPQQQQQQQAETSNPGADLLVNTPRECAILRARVSNYLHLPLR